MGTEGADERRVRQLLAARGVSYTPRPAAAAQERARDWLDDILDERPGTSPAPAPRLPDWRMGEAADLRGDDPDCPDRPVAADEPAGERRWDWSRLRHWPFARPACGACLALLPVLGGQSAALAWGHVLTQARTEAGVGAAYVLAAVGLVIGAVWVHNRRSWLAWSLLTCAFVGGLDMARLADIVTFTTGAAK